MNITDTKLVLKCAAQADDTVLMEGLHGIGKSDIVKTFAEEQGYHMETLFLSHQEVGDLIGMPRTIEKDGEILTVWTIPIWLQRMRNATFPHFVEFSDLKFNDKDFEQFVKGRLNI